MSVRDHPARYLLAAFALLTLLALGVAYRFIGEVTAIKGGYVLLGVLVAAALYTTRSETETPTREAEHLGRWSTKLVLLLCGGAYVVTYVTGTRLAAVVAALAIGYSLLAYQVFFAGATRMVVPQLAILFTVSPVTKYLSTGFYYGETDLLGHTRAIEVLYRTGQLESIGPVYSTYDSFPALHITAGAVGSFTGLPAYDSLITLGILSYTVATLVVYYLSRDFLSPSKAVAVTFVFSTLSVVHNYTTYFFPQALATVLLFFLFYVTVRRDSVPDRYHASLSVIALLTVGGLAFAHHVTQILFAGMVAALYAPSVLKVTEIGREWKVNDALPRLVPILFALTGGITHLITARTTVVDYFVQFTTSKIADPFVSDTGGERTVFGLGTDIPYHTPRVALESLLAVDGLYFIGLTALFVAGVVAVLVRYTRYTKVAGVVLLGMGSAMVVLKTPLLNVVSRLSLPLTLFFSFVAGIGLWRLGSRIGTSGENSTDGSAVKRVILLVLVVTVGVTGPLVAGDDLYGLHAGPNMWETYSTPEQQVDFSEQELQEFEALTRHVDQYAPEVTMLWVSREVSDRFGGAERPAPTDVSADGIRAGSHLAYRTAWSEHQVGYATDVAGTLYIADWWLYREINATNKVYTTGTTGVLWEQTVYLSNNRSVGR
ncbi:MAG: hypothetical protein V5A27_01340 [Halapricum sp.]